MWAVTRRRTDDAAVAVAASYHSRDRLQKRERERREISVRQTSRGGIRRLSVVLAVLALFAFALVPMAGTPKRVAAEPRKHSAGTDASEVSHWNEVAAMILVAIPGPNGGAPPAMQINMGMVQGAVYDAVNAIGPKQYRPYLLNQRTGANASVDAAVVTAAYDVLSALVSTRPRGRATWGRSSSRARRSSVLRHRLRWTARSGRLSSTRSRAWAGPPARPGPTSRRTLPGGGGVHPF
jgi:hypothetical protein